MDEKSSETLTEAMDRAIESHDQIVADVEAFKASLAARIGSIIGQALPEECIGSISREVAEAHRARMASPDYAPPFAMTMAAIEDVNVREHPVPLGLYTPYPGNRFPERGIDPRPYDEAHPDDPARAVADAVEPRPSTDPRGSVEYSHPYKTGAIPLPIDDDDDTKLMKPSKMKRTLLIAMAWKRVRLDRMYPKSALAGIATEPESTPDEATPAARSITTEFYAIRSALVMLGLWDEPAYERHLAAIRAKQVR